MIAITADEISSEFVLTLAHKTLHDRRAIEVNGSGFGASELRKVRRVRSFSQFSCVLFIHSRLCVRHPFCRGSEYRIRG